MEIFELVFLFNFNGEIHLKATFVVKEQHLSLLIKLPPVLNDCYSFDSVINI